MNEIVARRRNEQARLIQLARSYVEKLSGRLPLLAASVTGSVARGDFNVWSDVDVVIVAENLPSKMVDRTGLLMEGAPPGIQPVGFTPEELARAWRKRNRLLRDAVDHGIDLPGERTLAALVSEWEDSRTRTT
jgi:hypothetical protein